jgi:hypothetical protein
MSAPDTAHLRPDKIAAWPVEGDRYGIDLSYAGTTGYTRADQTHQTINASLTGGFDAAYAQARERAGEGGVDIAGGASTVRQARPSMPESSTSSRWTSRRSCSDPASGSSTASSHSGLSPSRSCIRR